MVTMKDIAEKAGVTIGTVDRALHNRGRINKATKEKILSIAKELDYKPNKIAQGLAAKNKKLRICFFLPNCHTNPFFKDVRDAAMEKAEELKAVGVEVTFFTMSAQISGKERPFFTEGDIPSRMENFDGMIAIGIKSNQLVQCLDIMEQRGCPVVFYNEKLANRRHLAYVGCDYNQSGKLAAGLCALAGNKDARVCVFTEGSFEVSVYISRMDAFNDEMERTYPRMKVLDYFLIGSSHEDNYALAQKMFEMHPNVNVVYVPNPGDYDICKAVSRADKKGQVKIITNDLVEPGTGMVERGIIAATICQEPETQGALPLELLFRYLAFGEEPEEKNIYTALSIHIAQNIREPSTD